MFAAHGRLESEVFRMTKNEIASLLWEFPVVDVEKNTILVPESSGEPFRHGGIKEYHFARPVMDIVRAAEQAGEYVSDYVRGHIGCLGLENNPQVGYEVFHPFEYSGKTLDSEPEYLTAVEDNLLAYVHGLSDEQAEKALSVM